MENSVFLISVNGKITNADEALIPAMDRGFLYGDSVYEATRTFHKKPFHWPFHLARLFESAKKMEIDITYSADELSREVQKMIDQHPSPNITLRIQLSRGTNRELGLSRNLVATKNNLIIYAKTLSPNPESWLTKGWKTMSYRLPFQKIGSQTKAGSYIENMLALERARALGLDDALFLNLDGSLLEGTTSNIWFIDHAGVIHTPSLDQGLLDGITRQSLIKLFTAQGIAFSEGRYDLKDLLNAREAFITSSSRFLVPIVEVDGHKIGSGAPGARTRELLNLYLSEIKKEYVI